MYTDKEMQGLVDQIGECAYQRKSLLIGVHPCTSVVQMPFSGSMEQSLPALEECGATETAAPELGGAPIA
jgi:hypothetical protein